MSTPTGGQPPQDPNDPSGMQGWSSPPPAGQPGPPGYPPGYQPVPVQQTNGLAVGALVASILGFFCGVGFIVGLILGYMARSRIRESGGREGGEGLAMAAIVIGWIGVALMVLGLLIVIGLFVMSAPTIS